MYPMIIIGQCLQLLALGGGMVALVDGVAGLIEAMEVVTEDTEADIIMEEVMEAVVEAVVEAEAVVEEAAVVEVEAVVEVAAVVEVEEEAGVKDPEMHRAAHPP